MAFYCIISDYFNFFESLTITLINTVDIILINMIDIDDISEKGYSRSS